MAVQVTLAAADAARVVDALLTAAEAEDRPTARPAARRNRITTDQRCGSCDGRINPTTGECRCSA